MPAKEVTLLNTIENVHDGGVGRLDDVVVDDQSVVVQDDGVGRTLQPLQSLVDVRRDPHHGLAVFRQPLQSVSVRLQLGAHVDPRHGRLTSVRQGPIAPAPLVVKRDELVVQPRRLDAAGAAAHRDVGRIPRPRGQPGVVGQGGGLADPVLCDREVVHLARRSVPPVCNGAADRASKQRGDGVQHGAEIHAAETRGNAANDVVNDAPAAAAVVRALRGSRVDVGPLSGAKVEVVLVPILTRRNNDAGPAGRQVYVCDGRPRRQGRLGERILKRAEVVRVKPDGGSGLSRSLSARLLALAAGEEGALQSKQLIAAELQRPAAAARARVHRDGRGQGGGAKERGRHLRDDLLGLRDGPRIVSGEEGVGLEERLHLAVYVGPEGQVLVFVLPRHQGDLLRALDLCGRGRGPDFGRSDDIGLDLGAGPDESAAALDNGGVVRGGGEVRLGLKVHSGDGWSRGRRRFQRRRRLGQLRLRDDIAGDDDVRLGHRLSRNEAREVVCEGAVLGEDDARRL